mmetsp:Transcript_1162/g.2948  ORF Transcript_1162/g.2948 Transcript_1162/m.2948 type:complete len:149 (+) Transcript_1162:186-632(+)
MEVDGADNGADSGAAGVEAEAPAAAAASSSGAPAQNRFEVKRWNAVALWAWGKWTSVLAEELALSPEPCCAASLRFAPLSSAQRSAAQRSSAQLCTAAQRGAAARAAQARRTRSKQVEQEKFLTELSMRRYPGGQLRHLPEPHYGLVH